MERTHEIPDGTLPQPIIGRKKRFRELDGFRGIAALMVVFSHLTYGYDTTYADGPRSIVRGQWGEFGVQLFFLISGFVILMSAERAKRPSDFVISRVSRLYPVYWVAVTEAIIITVALKVPDAQMSWADRLLNYTMIQRLIMVPNVDTVYWTLAIEMQFYVLILFLLILTRCHLTLRTIRWTGILWVGAALLIAVVFGGYSRGINPQWVWTPVKVLLNLLVVQWAPLFMAGMFAYKARSAEGPERRRHWWWAVVFGLVAALMHVLLHDLGGGLIVLAIVTCFMIVVAREHTRILLVRPLQWFGKISYSLYIGHLLFVELSIHYLWPYLGRPGAMVVGFGLALANACILHYVFETRVSALCRTWLLQQRDRWRARKERGIA